MSIRATERVTGVHRDTIMRLGVRVGTACAAMLDEKMTGLTCEIVEVDEMWSFVGKKQRLVTPAEERAGKGDTWVYFAVDRKTRIIPSYLVGKRDFTNTSLFVHDLASRLENQPTIYSDAANIYHAAVDEAFGDDVTFGQATKKFTSDQGFEERKYSPPKLTGMIRKIIRGQSDPSEVTTSHVEAVNNTARTNTKRLMRLTNGHSKIVENMGPAVALFVGYYNYVKNHSALKVPPAYYHGLATHFWTIKDLVRLSEPEDPPPEPETDGPKGIPRKAS